MGEGAGRGLRSLVVWGVAAVLLGCCVVPELPPPIDVPTEAPATLPAEADVCVTYCGQAGFSTGRCGCSSCNMGETALESVRWLTDEEFAAIQDGCGPLPGAEPALPCLWVCCCR